MHTTNAASRAMPSTYASRRAECEALLEIARGLEQFTAANADFVNSDRFDALQKEYVDQLENLLSISG